jgi:hypothetical protein
VAATSADRFPDPRHHGDLPLPVVSLQFGVKSWLTIASFAGSNHYRNTRIVGQSLILP